MCEASIAPKALVHNPRGIRSKTTTRAFVHRCELVQVSQQIRGEFLPILWCNFDHTIKFFDPDAYLEVFPKLPNNIKDTLKIITFYKAQSQTLAVDVAPLLRLAQSYPGIDMSARGSIALELDWNWPILHWQDEDMSSVFQQCGYYPSRQGINNCR